MNAIAKFTISLFCIIFLSVFISIVISDIALSTQDASNKNTISNPLSISKESVENTKSSVDLAVVIYAVSLGFIGLFSMYNALEIFKKKEQIDKEFIGLLSQQKDALLAVETQQKTLEFKGKELELGYSFKEIEFNVKELSRDIENKILFISNDMENIAKRHTEELNSTYIKLIKDIESKQNDLELFNSNMVDELSRVFYSNSLNLLTPQLSLIPNNRKKVISALMWFSQNGNKEDLELVSQFEIYFSNDPELKSLFDATLNELTKKNLDD